MPATCVCQAIITSTRGVISVVQHASDPTTQGILFVIRKMVHACIDVSMDGTVAIVVSSVALSVYPEYVTVAGAVPGIVNMKTTEAASKC